MQSKSYALSPLAEIDLEKIWFYTLQNWSLAQADSYHRDVVATSEGLASGTKRGWDVDVRPNYLKCPVGSHMVYFRDSCDQIGVIRVLHQRQDATLNLWLVHQTDQSYQTMQPVRPAVLLKSSPPAGLQ